MNPQQTTVTDSIIARVKSIDSPFVKFNDRNVIVVPEFTEPYKGFVDYLLQIRYPLISPYGAGGGSYLQRVTIEFGLFCKSSSDPKGEWYGALKRLGNVGLIIRRHLTDFSAGGLSINLFDTGQEMSPRAVRTEDGQTVKDSLWMAWTSWGLWAVRLTDFRNAPSP